MQVIHIKHKDYPPLLKQVHNPPTKLYLLGKLPDRPTVAIVGTRKPTAYGEMVAYRIAADLARAGVCVVSGLAYGIDSIVHRAALEAGGQTLAVLGSGLDNCYPARHLPLMKEIVATGGGAISEYEPNVSPLKHHFPARNRIIAGLSEATIVAEADAKSGSLITAQLALDEGRVVMAVPGPITSARSAGPNNLLKIGATAITSAADVCACLGFEKLAPDEPAANTGQLSAQARLILESLSECPKTTDDLAACVHLSTPALLSTLTLLELQGQVRSSSGSTWISAIKI
jgi:DNA processing protein